MRVLVVDDEYLELEQLKYLITEKYPLWEIFEAEDAAVAKNLLRKHTFHLAFIDIHLPGDNGLVLCAYIRENYKTECVMVTAFQDFNYARQSIKLHVFDYLLKPIIQHELYHVLESFASVHGNAALSPSIQKAVNYIEEHFAEKLSLQGLAEHIHMSPTYVSRRFSEETGMTFQEFLIQYRIGKAKELMKCSPFLSMGMIAEKTGFSSQNHFSTAFKKWTGNSPRDYKEKQNHD